MANMKVSEIISIFTAILKDRGNVDVIGECEDCTRTDMNIYVLTNEAEKGKCWIMVSSMRTLKQTNRYPRPWEKPEQPTDKKMGRAINRLRFKSRVWDKDGLPDYDYIYEMVCAVRKLTGLDHMSRELFDEGIQYCRIFSWNYKYALEEFRHLCWIDW